MSIASADKSSIVEKLWGKPQPKSSLLAYASADASSTSSLGPSQNLALEGTQPRYDQSTAVYDISAHMVYLPDGTKLEAHSGLGSSLDDPRSAKIRMRGVTPPHLYELTPREALFHGVPALRLNPVGGEEAIFGRTGLLAHTYMLGPNGDSNGCVSFRDYNAFLNAYRNQGIRRLAVVARRRLQVQPEARVGAEIAPQPDRRIRRHIARAAHDLGQAIGRNTQHLRQGTRRQAERHQIFLPQHLSGMSPQPRHRCLLNDSPRSLRPRDRRASNGNRRATAG